MTSCLSCPHDLDDHDSLGCMMCQCVAEGDRQMSDRVELPDDFPRRVGQVTMSADGTMLMVVENTPGDYWVGLVTDDTELPILNTTYEGLQTIGNMLLECSYGEYGDA